MIRVAQEQDVPAILDIYAPYILNTTATFEYDVPTEAEFLQRFQSITAQFPWLVWEEEGKILGYAYGSAPFSRRAYCWCSEVSIYLAPEARKRGIGRRLYNALEQLLWLQGYRVIYAHITSENTTSLAFHESLGYRHTATIPDCGVKFGRWLGVIWMEKRLKTVEIPSNPPTSWSSIVQDNKKLGDILDILSLS